jgi:BirA family biotin operon repressor/biotin-[acetyl-CoA-carboxylase] ligase
MNQQGLEQALSGLHLGSIRYFAKIGSTMNEAAAWAEQGASDLSLVLADSQTTGRGRQGRRWITASGAALAFSLIIRPGPFLFASSVPASGNPFPPQTVARLTALGAVAVCSALHRCYQLPAEIKWPNDVLLERRKVAGVLVEADWQGDQLAAAILGVGINVTPAAVPTGLELAFPATSIETELGKAVDRLALLRAILEDLLDWREQLSSPAFLQRWEQWLAFRGEWVSISQADGTWLGGLISEHPSLGPDGALRLQTRSGDTRYIQFGEVQLRPVTEDKGDRDDAR